MFGSLHTAASRRRARPIAGALASLVLAWPPLSALAADRPLTAAERQDVFQALQASSEPTEAPLGALSDATLIASLLRQGETETGQRLEPRRINRLWGLTPERRDLPRELQSALETGGLKAWLRTLAPDDPDYRALLSARCRYLALMASGGWPQLPDGPPLAPAQVHPQWALVARRLGAEGYDVTPEGEARPGPATLAAVRAFQARHGLEADGVVGPRTRGELNVSVEARLAQIEANLERRRWLPRRLPSSRLEVDVAGAEAKLHLEGAPRLAMRVIVGDLAHKTPLFVSHLDAVVINPPWKVPHSIATAELLPRAARDPGYLARNGFRWVGGQLQQRPGPGNALGRLKFDLESPYGVYLHDTPGRAAFSRSVRTLSHGCVRLEKPEELARLLLAPQGWSAADLERAIAAGATQRVALPAPLPLVLTYRTAFVADGELQFRPDPYGWDAALTAALAGERRADAPAPATECATPTG